MTTRVRLVAFALLVLAGLGGGYAVGAAVGPIDPPPTSAPHTSSTPHEPTGTTASTDTPSTDTTVVDHSTHPDPTDDPTAREEHGA